ncbi:thioester domain-containing protein [Plantactinospora sp. GCM10030261]|uniref:thioester domain-containing protein n=1 Tax=Plantactinospora sp. GCM10030261 TaxID=3273420 RepID=UPI003612E074
MFGRRAARWGRTALAVFAGAALTLGVAGPAAADPPVTGVPSQVEGGDVKLILNGKAKGTSSFTLAVDGESVTAYCIDFHTSIALGKEYREGTWDASQVKNLGKVQWVLTHGHPNVEAAKLAEAAGATLPTNVDRKTVNKLLYFGTQTAVWHFSDGVELGDWQDGKGLLPKAQYQVVQQVRDYLVKNATDQPEPKPSLTLDPKSASAAAGAKAGPFTVAGPAGAITLAVEGGQAVDATGKPVTETVNGGQFWLVGEGTGKVSVTATGSGSVSFGRVFLYPNGKAQKLILGGTAGEKVTAGAEAAFAAAPASPATPGGPVLPVTGSSTGIVLGLGAVLLAVGAVTVFFVRRRRLRFTA